MLRKVVFLASAAILFWVAVWIQWISQINWPNNETLLKQQKINTVNIGIGGAAMNQRQSREVRKQSENELTEIDPDQLLPSEQRKDPSFSLTHGHDRSPIIESVQKSKLTSKTKANTKIVLKKPRPFRYAPYPHAYKFYGQVHSSTNKSITTPPDEDVFNLLFRYPEPKTHGTFVEIGALDGVRFSNTKFFEDYLNWTGVLIEASPYNFERLVRNRNNTKVHTVHSAVCGTKGTVKFVGDRETGSVVSVMTPEFENKYRGLWSEEAKQGHDVPCEPMHEILARVNVTEVDFWSLDVEGSELMVLQNTDFSKVRVKSVLMENNVQCGRSVNLCFDILRKNGFCLVGDGKMNVLWVSTRHFGTFLCKDHK